MSGHVAVWIFGCENMQCGMFERVIAPGFEDIREVKDHGVIIALKYCVLRRKLSYAVRNIMVIQC